MRKILLLPILVAGIASAFNLKQTNGPSNTIKTAQQGPAIMPFTGAGLSGTHNCA
jgi:hypothetical protein